MKTDQEFQAILQDLRETVSGCKGLLKEIIVKFQGRGQEALKNEEVHPMEQVVQEEKNEDLIDDTSNNSQETVLLVPHTQENQNYTPMLEVVINEESPSKEDEELTPSMFEIKDFQRKAVQFEDAINGSLDSCQDVLKVRRKDEVMDLVNDLQEDEVVPKVSKHEVLLNKNDVSDQSNDMELYLQGKDDVSSDLERNFHGTTISNMANYLTSSVSLADDQPYEKKDSISQVSTQEMPIILMNSEQKHGSHDKLIRGRIEERCEFIFEGREVHKILMKVTYIIWNWYYKSCGIERRTWCCFLGLMLEETIDVAKLKLPVEVNIKQESNFVMEEIGTVIGGSEKKIKVISKLDGETITYHETGHTIAELFLEHAEPFVKVTIVHHGTASLGFATYTPNENLLKTKERFFDMICRNLGGYAFEQALLEKINFINWKWFYKKFMKKKEMAHPGNWNMEWKIAWLLTKDDTNKSTSYIKGRCTGYTSGGVAYKDS